MSLPVPPPDPLPAPVIDSHCHLDVRRADEGAPLPVGDLLAASRQKAAITEAMRTVGEVNTYLSQQAPWKLKNTDPQRMRTVLHTAAQAVDDCNRLLSPFLPHSAQRVHEMLGRSGTLGPLPQVREVDDLDGGPSYPVLMGEYSPAVAWAREPIAAGTPVQPPTPVFTKLDVGIVEQELARLEEAAGT